jgi:hypothetical protein
VRTADAGAEPGGALWQILTRMNWAVVAPYVAASVALGVGFASAVLSARNVKRTLDQQRAMAREERIWNKQAEAYVDLLEWSEKARHEAYEAQERLKAGSGSDGDAQFRRLPPDVSARVAAYGSQAVDEAVRHLRERLDAPDEADSASSDNPFRELSLQLRWVVGYVDAHDALKRLVRRELQTDERDNVETVEREPGPTGNEGGAA